MSTLFRNLKEAHIFRGVASRARLYSEAATAKDPLGLVAPELAQIRSTLPRMVASQNAQLSEVAQYYFNQPSKLVCPTVAFLFARATNGLGRSWGRKLAEDRASRSTTPAPSIPSKKLVPVLSTQHSLAEILELIHTASLIHDDVIDASPIRRGVASAPAKFGDKVAILGGDYVLGQAWNALSRLQNPEVAALMMGVLEDLIAGELMQLRDQTDASTERSDLREKPLDRCLRKAYLKTASLVAKGAEATVLLGGCEKDEAWPKMAFSYGRDLGIAFQLIDDALDYESDSPTLGKPGGADLHLGSVTAPALYAEEEHPEMSPLIQRCFSGKGDVEKATQLVRNSSALHKTRQLAHSFAANARKSLDMLPDTEAKYGLEFIVEKVVHRKS